MLIEKNKRIDDMSGWPAISLGNIFAYILEKKCVTGYILGAVRTKKYTYIAIVDLLAPFAYMNHVLKKSCVFVLFS